MDKWLVNMAAGATLSALLVIFGVRTFIDITYTTRGGAEPEPEVAATDPGGSGGAAPVAEPATPLPVLLASASVENGAKEAKKCVACHSFDEGGANKIGPNLYGVLGRAVGSYEGFAYSNALIEFGGEWTYERISCFLENPKDCVPGNKMTFAGVKKDTAKANLIVYLKSISPDAPALPEPTESASAEPASGGQQETTPASTVQN
ncbi:MAG: cytochrome c family protein [Hyphomicrobiales bacterium]|nr:cytochrome c family protein [Hyphomicrobiales bacterium]